MPRLTIESVFALAGISVSRFSILTLDFNAPAHDAKRRSFLGATYSAGALKSRVNIENLETLIPANANTDSIVKRGIYRRARHQSLSRAVQSLRQGRKRT